MGCLEPQSVTLTAVGRLQHGNEVAQPVVFLGTASNSRHAKVSGLRTEELRVYPWKEK